MLGFYAPIVVLEATQRGTILEPWVCVVGLGAAVMAIRHERRPGWKVVAILAGLFHVVVVGVFLFLGALMRGWVSP
ncbi:hypothetical protein [Pedococcus soli]